MVGIRQAQAAGQGFGPCTHWGVLVALGSYTGLCSCLLFVCRRIFPRIFPLNLLPSGHAQAQTHSHTSANLFALSFAF